MVNWWTQGKIKKKKVIILIKQNIKFALCIIDLYHTYRSYYSYKILFDIYVFFSFDIYIIRRNNVVKISKSYNTSIYIIIN